MATTNGSVQSHLNKSSAQSFEMYGVLDSDSKTFVASPGQIASFFHVPDVSQTSLRISTALMLPLYISNIDF